MWRVPCAATQNTIQNEKLNNVVELFGKLFGKHKNWAVETKYWVPVGKGPQRNPSILFCMELTLFCSNNFFFFLIDEN